MTRACVRALPLATVLALVSWGTVACGSSAALTMATAHVGTRCHAAVGRGPAVVAQALAILVALAVPAARLATSASRTRWCRAIISSKPIITLAHEGLNVALAVA